MLAKSIFLNYDADLDNTEYSVNWFLSNSYIFLYNNKTKKLSGDFLNEYYNNIKKYCIENINDLELDCSFYGFRYLKTYNNLLLYDTYIKRNCGKYLYDISKINQYITSSNIYNAYIYINHTINYADIIKYLFDFSHNIETEDVIKTSLYHVECIKNNSIPSINYVQKNQRKSIKNKLLSDWSVFLNIDINTIITKKSTTLLRKTSPNTFINYTPNKDINNYRKFINFYELINNENILNNLLKNKMIKNYIFSFIIYKTFYNTSRIKTLEQQKIEFEKTNTKYDLLSLV